MSALLSPDSLQKIQRLDVRARMVVKGFLQGLHTSPFQGFSVQFSEHRRYNRGDDPKLIDWLVYAKTDKYYVKRFEAETNMIGYLVMDLSQSMGFTESQSMTKFEYATCLAASLTYLMNMQQDPVGLITFDEKIHAELPARSRRGHLGDVLSHLAKLKPTGQTNLPCILVRCASMLKHNSLIMIFSDLWPAASTEAEAGSADPDATAGELISEAISALARLRYAGHDVIVFHVLDEAEVTFPFSGSVDLIEPESSDHQIVDAAGIRSDYISALNEMRDRYRQECFALGIDYVPLDTSMPFDKALTEYLYQRQARF